MSQITESDYPVGVRVLVVGEHPHSGKSGVIERYETAQLREAWPRCEIR